MRRYRVVGMVLGVLILAIAAPATLASDVTELTGTYALEVPQNPNAVPGFEGSGVIQYSLEAAGGVYFLAAVTTNTPNTTYWLMINPAPIVERTALEPTGDYRIFEIRTDANGVGYAAGQVELTPGAWEFHGFMTANPDLHVTKEFLANTPLCFPGPMGPLTVTTA